jgi:nucleotide-binding universal stress UspA family protein
MSVFLAYDGSNGSDWVSHYAVRMAARHPSAKLELIHVNDPRVACADLAAKTDRIRKECQRASVTCDVAVHELRGSVDKTLLDVVPAGGDSYLICGARVRSGRRGFLAGTVSERLLRSGHCHVLAMRVLHPGLLGLPGRLLLPVSGHPRGFRSGLAFLKLFRPDVSHLFILYVERVFRWRFRRLSHEAAQRLRTPGELYCDRVEQEIRDQLVLGPDVVGAEVVISDDVPKEIVIAANKTKSRLIYLGASERNLTERFFYGNPVEQVLRDATCDVAIYRGIQ